MEFTDSDLLREVKSTYIHVPLLLKFSTKRLNNFKPFIVGGFLLLSTYQVIKIILMTIVLENLEQKRVSSIMN